MAKATHARVREAQPEAPAFARALATEPGDCALCGSAFGAGDEVLAHDQGERFAHYDCGREVEGWAWA